MLITSKRKLTISETLFIRDYKIDIQNVEDGFHNIFD